MQGELLIELKTLKDMQYAKKEALQQIGYVRILAMDIVLDEENKWEFEYENVKHIKKRIREVGFEASLARDYFPPYISEVLNKYSDQLYTLADKIYFAKSEEYTGYITKALRVLKRLIRLCNRILQKYNTHPCETGCRWDRY
ncbi:MAG: hypothetical protein QW416_09080 [Candidatus Nitrosocaldaceae archaeon]